MTERKTQKIEGDGNVQAQNYIANQYNSFVNDDLTELTIVDELLQHIKENAKRDIPNASSINEKFVKIDKKISINFKPEEQAGIKTLFTYAFSKISLIEERIGNMDSDDQACLHSHFLGMYLENKANGLTPLQNLTELFKKTTPANRSSDPKYTSFAQSIILFFFDDCTIFEKTPEEVIQLKLL
ncbi:hypothetical protein KXQ82_10860 [Mucilaginibacter sp. HMF5004]|uniref:hypothetical protein n=1 Tax=Mucilaginibacter rivuli TaxID=2857527 RepID=UPI001C606E50|nr:hypothetical protein [Mucilaginibacter rivuli]MBW4890221.1 hypothetical protein [Mucilaginibacter rivuli]